jgi:two-component sensor histidine kinase
MFGNVGRRIHNLTGRQLSLIDAAEREETDPSVLERLYRIDHLAVRLQRGADSLMLLSGETEPVLSDAPLRLTDVVRSAVGRVEGYQRVVLSAEGDVTVAPAAVGDLTLIVAELVENAVSFSPATSAVDISVRPARGGARVEIVDHGVGMTAARLEEENARLVRRERLDLAPTKVLGLFVVGRLARRSGIVVRLAATEGGGVTVRLEIGSDLLFDLSEQLAPPRPAAQAPRSRPSGTPPPALPEQRVPREITDPHPTGPTAAVNGSAANANGSAVNGVPAVDGLPVRRRPAAPDRAGAAHSEDAASTAARPLAEAGRTRRDPAPGPDGAATANPHTLEPAASAEGAPTAALPRRSRARAAVRDPAIPAAPALAAAHRLDAEAARAAVEEFEAGVEEALRVSAQDLPTLRASDEPEGIRP